MNIQGEIIKAWRKKHNVSQLELAKRAGVVQPVISYIEQGDRLPKPDIALDIEKATNGEIKAEWLIFPEKYAEEIKAYIEGKQLEEVR